jgi:hypothetical protein
MRREDNRLEWFKDTPAARRALLVNQVISAGCAASALVPILGIFACMWLGGWRPQHPRR